MQNVKVKRNGRQAETECLQHFCYGTISAAHAERVEKGLARQRVSRQQRANARIGAIDDSLGKRVMVAGHAVQTFSTGEDLFLLEGVRASHRRSFDRDEELIPNWIVAGGRQPARNGVLRKYEIGVA